MILIESNQNHAVVADTEVCTTLPALMGLGGGYVPMILTFMLDVGEYCKQSDIAAPLRVKEPYGG